MKSYQNNFLNAMLGRSLLNAKRKPRSKLRFWKKLT
jgi:hypothetical protein